MCSYIVAMGNETQFKQRVRSDGYSLRPSLIAERLSPTDTSMFSAGASPTSSLLSWGLILEIGDRRRMHGLPARRISKFPPNPRLVFVASKAVFYANKKLS